MLINLILLISAAICLLFGVIKYLGKKVAMFSILVIGAMGCFLLGHLYDTVTLLIQGTLPPVFNIGMLARVGGFAFLFSASFAQLDGLADDRSKALRKYRLFGFGGFLLMGVLFVPLALSELQTGEKAVTAVIFAFGAMASYYHIKHLFIPDVSFGIIDAIRPYCLVALLSTLLFGAMTVAGKLGHTTAYTLLGVLLALTYPCIVFSMERGRQKWIT